MRTGKLPEHTFKRSVMNPIRYRLPDISFRAAVGHDGAVFGDMVTSMATTAFCYTGNELYALDNSGRWKAIWCFDSDFAARA